MDNGSYMLITCNIEHTKMSHKTHIHGFKLSLVQKNLSSWFLLKCSCCKFRYDTFQKVNSKGAEQSVWMRRLLYAFVVHTSQDSFSAWSTIWASTRENLSWGVCEQHRCRPTCASAQSDQRLCYSRFGKYHI